MLKLDSSKKTKSKKLRRQREFNYERAGDFLMRVEPKYMNLPLLISVLALSIFGVLMVYSASHYNAITYFGNPFYFFTRQLIGLVMGIVALAMAYFFDYRLLKKYVWAIVGIAVGLLLLVFVPGIGISRLGAQRWIGVGGFTMQPSEVAKFAFIIFAAYIFSKHVSKQPTVKNLGLVLLIGGGFCALILMQPNLSITLTLGTTMFIMLFLCGVKLKHMFILILPVLVLFPIMLIAEPYRIRRLVAFVDPWATPRAEGFQLIQSLFSLGNGGLFGRGFLNSTQKYMFLPFSESDFIFSIIAEEFGFIGAIAFVALLGFIIWRIFKIGMESKDTFGKYLCFGIATLIFVQSSINLAVVTGSIPPTGLPLPFISFGGTSLAVYMGGIGIALNVHKRNVLTIQKT